MKEFNSFFKKVEGNEGDRCHYPTRLDTYGCGCGNNCSYCLHPDTNILMYDGTIKKLSKIKVGDEIYGLEDSEGRKKLVKSIVINKWETNKPAYRIKFEDGREVICSGGHRWLSNRGWKYTIGDMTGNDRKPYLTYNNLVYGFTGEFVETPVDTDEYKKGYLSGIIRGDGTLKTYDYSGRRRNKDIQYQFRLAMKDDEGIDRVKEYLSYFGIDTNDFLFKMKDRKTKNILEHKSIRINTKESYDKIKDLIEYSDSNEYRRGFLAGFYDAEGCSGKLIKRVFNTDETLISFVNASLDLFNFKYQNEVRIYKSKTIFSVRILGGISEFLRFRQLTNTAILRKFNLDGVSLKTRETNKIVSIEKISDNEKLIDITTTTENFVANGFISHNCYARSLLAFRKLWNPQEPSVADIKKIKRVIDKKIQPGEVIRLGGMTDCFQNCEDTYHVTKETIKALNEKGVHYLIVTKNADLISRDDYMEVLDKKLAHIQVSLTNTDEELGKKIEPGAPSYKERIKGIEKLQENGFDVTLRLSPYIPEFVNLDVINAVKCDKILVEFLRVNTWIEKWLKNVGVGVDLSKYELKSAGYKHLPLKTKKELIDKITGFKDKSVCEDVEEHWQYWKDNFNCNPEDCCNLRLK